MEDGFAAFARLNTEAELRSTFVVERPGKKDQCFRVQLPREANVRVCSQSRGLHATCWHPQLSGAHERAVEGVTPSP